MSLFYTGEVKINDSSQNLILHQQMLRNCTACPNMIGPVITCEPVMSKIVLVGQAPGDREGVIGKPFGWTAGKTLFKWFASQGVSEAAFRESVYIASVCRCFPGKKTKRRGSGA